MSNFSASRSVLGLVVKAFNASNVMTACAPIQPIPGAQHDLAQCGLDVGMLMWGSLANTLLEACTLFSAFVQDCHPRCINRRRSQCLHPHAHRPGAEVTTALLEGYRRALSSQSSVGRPALHVSAVPAPEFLMETVSCSVGAAPFTRAAFNQGTIKTATGTASTTSFVDDNINTNTVTGNNSRCSMFFSWLYLARLALGIVRDASICLRLHLLCNPHRPSSPCCDSLSRRALCPSLCYYCHFDQRRYTDGRRQSASFL